MQEAYEHRVLEIEEAARLDPEKAFAIINEIRALYSHRDHDGWLRRSLCSHEARILEKNERYEEALSHYRSLSEHLAADPVRFISNQLAMAYCLKRLDRPREALDEIERGLSAAPGAPETEALNLLTHYAEIAVAKGWDVPAHYQDIFCKTAHAWGIELSLYEGSVGRSLAHSILGVAQQRRESNLRYQRLLREVRTTEGEAREVLLKRYVKDESVGFFRSLAQNILETNGIGSS